LHIARVGATILSIGICLSISKREEKGFAMKDAGKQCRFTTWVIVGLSLSLTLFAQSSEQQGNAYDQGFGEGIEVAAVGGAVATPFANSAVWSALQVFPSLAGAYKSSAQRPRVFTTPDEINDMVRRINTAGSFSAQNFAKLTGRIKEDLSANVDWDAAYSGCDLDIYLHSFSYEPPGGYAGEIRNAAELSAAMHVKPGLAPPNGAAIVAARLALYAVLVKAGANSAPGSPTSGEAAALAKRILLAWSSHGFRETGGSIVQSPTNFCEADGTVTHGTEAAAGLQIARGIIYSVQSQDLLESDSIAAFNASQRNELNTFHNSIFNLIRGASNFRAGMQEMNGPDSECERYSNHVAAHLIGLLAIARLLDDSHKFNAVLYGNDRSIPVAIPWTAYFNHAVYGEHDRPIACHKNKGPDALTSHPFFQTNVVAPGEILDRYRDLNTGQMFGYTMMVLGDLYDMAEIMRNSGFDAYAYRGAHQQSIEMSTQYYACYGKGAGFGKVVTPENSRSCPDYQQYVGQIVNGLGTVILLGADQFPKNPTITGVDAGAREDARREVLDAIRFGRWRD
jgi:hypothetical protein